ncbi:MAG: CHAT domain-containing protein [Saprospiraceae bacterium]|nr:CHAT domain-containing protein [Candidatus Vicinibacter affinis]
MGKNHPDYAACLQNLGALYSSMGNFEKSEMFYLEAQSIFEKVLGQEHPIYANSLHSLAILYRNMGKLNQAETIALEAMHIREKLLGKEHPDYAESLQDLGTIYEIMGNYEKAEPLYFESKKFFESVVGKEHPKYAVSMSNLAHLYEAQKRFSNSEPLLEEAFTIMHSNLAKATSYLSEQELSKYITAIQKNGDKLSAYLRNRQIDGAHPGILPSLVFDQMLFYKGFLLNAATRLNSTSMLSPQTTEINLSLKAYRRKLSTEYAKPISDRKGVAELEEKANVAEKQLSRLVVGYVDALRPIKWKHVQVKLNKTEAAIEFVSFKLNFPKKYDSIIYAALLLKSGNDPPQFFHLFEEKSLDSLLQSKSERKADYVNTLYSLSDRGVVVVETSKKSIYDIIWKPLEKELSGIKTIYFSPSGLLHRINLDAIPISETETLADKYQLIELNSTRQLVLPTKINTSNNQAVLYGGIQFEQDSLLTHSEPILASRSRGELSFHYVDSTLRGGIWNYLPGTEKEVNSIERIMEASGVKTNLIKGYSATEEAFKNIGTNNHSSPRILHIATHGYFFDDPKVQAKSNGLSSQNESVFKISDHPMLRSGLILAGGNAAWQGKQTLEGREDGVLTAYEISQMNLSNTELVVLSACETGLGDIQGKRRSVWSATRLQNRRCKISDHEFVAGSDKQTSLLMTTFYKKWLEEK